jgi:hypothetical protein
MIRFSHTRNSWQVHVRKGMWASVSPAAARMFFDRGYTIVHFEQLGLFSGEQLPLGMVA